MAAEKPLKVYILAGQSNMAGHGYVRTIDAPIVWSAKHLPME